MENLEKKIETLLNSVFSRYFWQPKIRVKIGGSEDGEAFLVDVLDGKVEALFYFPESYFRNPAVLAEEVLKAYCLERAKEKMKVFERHLSQVRM